MPDPLVFFLEFRGETRKITHSEEKGDPPLTFESLIGVLAERFKGFERPESDGDVNFIVKDLNFNVEHRLEDIEELYNGARVRVTLKGETSKEETKLKEELEEMKEKMRELEKRDSGRKRQRDDEHANDRGDGKRHRSEEEKARPVITLEHNVKGDYIVRMIGLPWECKESDIREFFNGLAVKEKGILIELDQMGRASGSAYVAFETEQDFKGGLGKHKENLGKRYVEIFTSSEKDVNSVVRRMEGKQNYIHKSSRTPSEAAFVVRLRGIPYSANIKKLEEFMAAANPEGIHILCDHVGRPSGEAYVELGSPEDQRKALELHKQNLGSRYIEVFASSYIELDSALRGGRGRKQTERDPTCLLMRGLPYDATHADIREFYRREDLLPTRIHMKERGGQAYVEFRSEDDARHAVRRLNREYIGSRYVDLVEVPYQEVLSSTGSFRPQGRPHGNSYGRRDDYGRGDYGRGDYGRNGNGRYDHRGGTASSASYAPQTALPPDASRMRIEGLPWRATHQEVEEFFRGYAFIPGTVEFGQDDRGRPSGKGWISFVNIAAAREALVSRDAKYIGSRYVKLYIE